MNAFKFTSIFLGILTLAGVSFAAEKPRTLIASTGQNHVPLLELYSSEGCSSCPPADRWISKFSQNPDLWKKFVPIVFHVDYWNRLGWKDEFSTAQMTKRQHEYAGLWGTDTVYTPGVVLDGKEWRGWSGANSVQNDSKMAPIPVSLYREADGSFTVKLDQKKPGQRYRVKIAKLGMDVSSKVTRGENSGETLVHNFIVLNWDTKDLSANESEANFKVNLTDRPDQKAAKHAIAAWIEEDGVQQPVQAVGGYL